jgi:hypothetical protein
MVFLKMGSHEQVQGLTLGICEGKEESSEDTHVIMQTINKGGLNGGHDCWITERGGESVIA